MSDEMFVLFVAVGTISGFGFIYLVGSWLHKKPWQKKMNHDRDIELLMGERDNSSDLAKQIATEDLKNRLLFKDVYKK